MNFILSILILFLLYRFVRVSQRNVGADAQGIAKSLMKAQQIGKQEQERIERREKTMADFNRSFKRFSQIKFFRLSDKKWQDLEYYALRLHKIKNGVHLGSKELYVQRCRYISYYILIVLLSCAFNLKFALLLFFYPLIGNFIDSNWESTIQDQNDLIEEDFYDFYSEIFYTYKFPDKVGIPLEKVVSRYQDRANEETRYLIDMVKADSKISEKQALDNLKKYYKIPNIQRLVNQLTMVLAGKTMIIDDMLNFKNELDAARNLKLEEENKRRCEKAESITIIPIGLLLCVVFFWIIITLTNLNK